MPLRVLWAAIPKARVPMHVDCNIVEVPPMEYSLLHGLINVSVEDEPAILAALTDGTVCIVIHRPEASPVLPISCLIGRLEAQKGGVIAIPLCQLPHGVHCDL